MAALLLAACGGDADGVVGRWHAADEQVDFFDGGRLLLRRPGGSVAARYELVEPRRMLVTFDGASAGRPPEDWSVELRADSLVLCETDRPLQCVRYARVAPGTPPPFAARAPAGSPRLADGPSLAADPSDPSAGGAGAPRELMPPRGPLPPEARAAEAGPVLKQLYVLQETYRMEHGRYAATLDELARVGWEAPRLRNFAPPRIVRADARRLCVVMEPRGADLWPMHVDERGVLARGRACG